MTTLRQKVMEILNQHAIDCSGTGHTATSETTAILKAVRDSVPDMMYGAFDEVIHEHSEIRVEGVHHGWNACRTAMLEKLNG